VAAPAYETTGLLIEKKFSTGTYAAVQATRLKSDLERSIGTFEAPTRFGTFVLPFVPSSTRQALDYEEQNLTATLNQLVGNEWSLGARYQLTSSNLEARLLEVASVALPLGQSELEATLHQANLFALYHHACGFFARIDGNYYQQSNRGYATDIPGDEFFQLDVSAGYRFPRNFGDVTVGFLNVTDQDYKLNPLNSYNELPRERTLALRLRVNF